MSKEYNISVIPGDGTGPEVVAEGIKVLETVACKCDFSLNFNEYNLGGEHFKATGEILPDNMLETLAKSDAIYLGAIGHPDVKPGILEKGILLKLRFHFDQYINLRPVKLYEGVDTPLKGKGPDDIDFVVVRENTEGLYAGAGGCLKRGTLDEVAIQESINTRKGVERCIRYAFEYCRKRNKRKKLTFCGKTNVLTFAFDLWERVFNEVAKEYPDIETDYAHVDAICMWMVKNPEWFDVIVTDNINPIAAISAAQIMLETIGEPKAASWIEEGVIKVLRDDLKDVAAGKMGYSTQEVGDLVAEYIKKG